MTARILTAGHIKLIEKLSKKGEVIIGVLDQKALEGYKSEVVPFTERFYIMSTVAKAFPNVRAVRQSSLSPKRNLKQYRCTAMASGDGWEPEEQQIMGELMVKQLDIKSGYTRHSSDIVRDWT